MARNLKEEVEFWNKLAQWAGNSLPKKKIVELKELFEEDGGLKSFVEKEIRRLIVNIKQGKVSLKGFTTQDAERLRALLDCTALDQNLLSELSHLLYGADERAEYFKCGHLKNLTNESVGIHRTLFIFSFDFTFVKFIIK